MDNLPTRIFVCSALRGAFELNLARTREYCHWTMSKGFAAYAPHLSYPQFFDDDVSFEREMCITAGLSFLSTCSELWAFCVDGRISSGMLTEIQTAIDLEIPVRFHAVTLRPQLIGGNAIQYLAHLPVDLVPSEADLLDVETNADRTAKVFADIKAKLEAGSDFYEDLEDSLDGVLGTEMVDRDHELEETWQEAVDNATD